MERLTTKIATIKENVDFQQAIDKLSIYEDAEEAKKLVFIPERIFYIYNSCIYEGAVLEVTCAAGSNPNFLVEHKHDGETLQLKRVLNIDAFCSEEAAKERFNNLYATEII